MFSLKCADPTFQLAHLGQGVTMCEEETFPNHKYSTFNDMQVNPISAFLNLDGTAVIKSISLKRSKIYF